MPRDVPDPYHGESDGFATVLEILERACPRILDELVAISNYSWNGYQPPVNGLDRRALSAAGSPFYVILPNHLLHFWVLT